MQLRHGTLSEKQFLPKLSGLDDLGSSLITLEVFLEQYRAMWEDRLDRLGEYLKSVAAQPAEPTTKKSARTAPRAKNSRGKRHEKAN